MVVALWSCQVSQGSNTRGSASVDERAYGLTGMQSLTISLKIYNFVIILFLPLFLGLFPRVLLKINMAMNSGAIGNPPLQQPQVEAGRVSCWEGVARSHGWQPPHCGILRGVVGLLLGQVSVVCEAGGESATEGPGQGQTVL